MTELENQLIRHEGKRLKPYKDTVGKLTIGVGRNLDDVGISEDEVLYLLHSDIDKATQQVAKWLPWTDKLDRVRCEVLINMTFNMGIAGLLQFKNMLSFLEQRNYERAAQEMLNSKWAIQVGQRGYELSKQMETGQYGG